MEKNLKKPQRLCMACREKKEKEKLIRIVKEKGGKIYIDLTKKAQGRGVYLCDNLKCFEKFKKKKALERGFKCYIEEKIYIDLENKIKNL